ncbi:MAG TPA: NYN domain-containing protein [Thermoanaerobaculia bacterium]|nr:NYN domain-containing protein [Thermoanaerobaculia bacterium]
MQLLIDGSNVLGRMRADRENDDVKRALTRALASFCRRHHARVWCLFDGERPSGFGTSIGAVQVIFSGKRDADSVLVERALQLKGQVICVTSDAGLAGRVRSRRCEVRPADWLIRDLNSDSTEVSGTTSDVDWESYFSEDKNRNV